MILIIHDDNNAITNVSTENKIGLKLKFYMTKDVGNDNVALFVIYRSLICSVVIRSCKATVMRLEKSTFHKQYRRHI